MKNNLPNLIVIGAMKCGTTSLHSYLDQHPDFKMSAKKEIDFFAKEKLYAKGLKWYSSHFDSSSKFRGESSQNYSKFHYFQGSAKRIFDTLPNVKMIYVVRDPVDRLVSHYYENQEGGESRGALNDFLSENLANNHYILTSQYYKQLEEFLKYFKEDQFLVIASEDLKENRLQTMNEIFQFLGAETIQDSSIFDFNKNTQSEKRKDNALGQLLLGKSMGTVRKLFPTSLKKSLKNSKAFRSMTSATVETVEIDNNLQHNIRNFLKEDVEKLRAFTGKKFEKWSL